MKKAVFYIVLLLLLCQYKIFAQYKKISVEKLTVAGNQYFFKTQPLNGRYVLKYNKPNAYLSEKVNFSNGFKNDSSAIIFNRGRKEEAGSYKDGLKEGKWTVFDVKDGQIKIITDYRKGLKDGFEYNFLYGVKDTLQYQNGKFHGWQSVNKKYSSEKKLYEDGVLKKSIEIMPKKSFKKECNYYQDHYLCESNEEYKNVFISEKVIGKYQKQFEKTTIVNDTITHRVFAEKMDGDKGSIITVHFYQQEQEYEKWEVIFPDNWKPFSDDYLKLLDEKYYEIRYFTDDKKLNMSYQLECSLFSFVNLYPKADFFIYDYAQDRFGYTKNFRKYRLIDDGERFCVHKYIEGNE